MERYMPEKESAYEAYGEDIERIVRTTADRYIGQNPPQPLVYRAYNKNGTKRLADYRYDFNLDAIFPWRPARHMHMRGQSSGATRRRICISLSRLTVRDGIRQ